MTPPAAPTVLVTKSLGAIALIRLGGSPEEPPDKDVIDGLKQEGLVEGTSYTLASKDAGGDASKLGALIDEAVKGSPSVVITLTPQAAAAATTRVGSVPLVSYTGAAIPESLGLASGGGEQLKSTACYCPLRRSNLVAIAASCVPTDKRRLGIVVDPDDPVSRAAKDSLLTADVDLLSVLPTFEIAEARAPGDVPGAVRDLAGRKVSAFIVVPGKSIDGRALIEEAAKLKLPVFGITEDQAKAGAVLVRIPSPRWGGFEAGRLAGRVLKGTDTRALPVREGTVVETLVNQSAGKQLNFKVRGEFLRTAKMLP